MIARILNPIKKKWLSPDNQSLLTLNLIPWKTHCKITGNFLFVNTFSPKFYLRLTSFTHILSYFYQIYFTTSNSTAFWWQFDTNISIFMFTAIQPPLCPINNYSQPLNTPLSSWLSTIYINMSMASHLLNHAHVDVIWELTYYPPKLS